jgi:branched-chain amino acid aminotransferase
MVYFGKTLNRDNMEDSVKMSDIDGLGMKPANLDWANMGFGYVATRSHVRMTWMDGRWSEPELINEPYIKMSIAATCLHYGQEAFEGLKAFRCKDGKVRVFRPWENIRRMNNTADYILMPQVPEELYLKCIQMVVRDNQDYVPPYGTGGSLYIRPLLIGTGAQIGVSPAKMFDFIILVTPVGAYYKGGLTPVEALVITDFDRAAPRGTGHIKVGGNYAASLLPSKKAKEQHYPITLFLDPETHTYIDEFGTSNFFAITKDNKYITPKSRSILPSITNMTLQQIAKDIGLTVECRPVNKAELADVKEVGACGTAVVVTPISKIVFPEKTYEYGETCGETLTKLYENVTGIQTGELPDRHNWLFDI